MFLNLLALIIAFSVFIIIGAAMFTWLIPLIICSNQSFILDIPRLDLMIFKIFFNN